MAKHIVQPTHAYTQANNSIMTSGCLFWIIAPLVLLFVVASPFLLPIVNTVEDNAAARRDKEAASRAQADAAKISAQAQADALLILTHEGVAAIKTDRHKAHPLQYLAETLVKILAIVCAVLLVTLLGFVAIYYKDPTTGQAVFSLLAKKKESS